MYIIIYIHHKFIKIKLKVNNNNKFLLVFLLINTIISIVYVNILYMNSNKNEIINKISNEIIAEVQNSNQKITKKEVENKINKKIQQIIEQKRLKDEIKRKEQFEKEEKFIQNEFTNIGNVEEYNENEDEKENNIEDEENNGEEELLENNEEDNEENNNEEITEKQPFLLTISELYKEEFNKSINGFKNFLGSFQFLQNTSLFEKILLSLFVIVPALLSGFVGIFIILIILLFWQISILINVFLKFFTGVESYFYGNIVKIKKFIDSLKSDGGLFNKLIFSNFLYSIVFINGILYLFMKGISVPLTSIDMINKFLANVVCKATRTASNILSTPASIALSNIQDNGLLASKSAKSKSYSKSSSKSRTYSGGIGFFAKNQAKNRMKKARKTNIKANDLTMNSRYMTEAIFENKKAPEFDKNLSQNNTLNKQHELTNQDKLRDLVIDSENQKKPESYNLSDRLMEEMYFRDMMQNILDNVRNSCKDNIVDTPDIIPDFNPSMPEIKKDNTMNKINSDLKIETQEKIDGINSAQNNLNQLGYDNPMSLSSQYKEMRDSGVEYPVTETLKAQNENWDNLSQDDKIRAGISVGEIRAGQEDLRDLHHYNEWTKNDGKDVSYETYLSTKLENAKRDYNQELSEFKERYGEDCSKLIEEGMKEHNIPIEQPMNNQEFEKVAMSIVKKFPEEQQVEMAKDLREYNLTYLEMQNCEKDLNKEKNNEKEKSETEKKQEKEEVTNKISNSMKSFVSVLEEQRKSSQSISNMADISSKDSSSNKKDTGRSLSF